MVNLKDYVRDDGIITTDVSDKWFEKAKYRPKISAFVVGYHKHLGTNFTKCYYRQHDDIFTFWTNTQDSMIPIDITHWMRPSDPEAEK